MKQYKNPIIPTSADGRTADSYVIRHDGKYYHCYSGHDGVYITKADELCDIASGDAVLKIKNLEGIGRFQVFRGSIQGAWFDSGYITEEITEIKIKKSENTEILKRIANEFNQPFSPEVVRVIIHTREFEIFGIDGDIRPQKTEEMPKHTLLAYGSSITHDLGGGAEQGWLAQVGYNLGKQPIPFRVLSAA